MSEFDYDGAHLTWVMNGYGGRVQEVGGRFSATRDRGVFVPRPGVKVPDFTYMRFAMERQLVAAAVGRRVDGRLNEYTKVYPNTAGEVLVSLPVDSNHEYDYPRMIAIGAKLRRIELHQKEVREASRALRRAAVQLDVASPALTIGLGDTGTFRLSIGKRVLRNEHSAAGVPVYSANVLAPFGYIATSNLESFDRPSLLWGIDGNFDWNLIEAGKTFATTDHCGRVEIFDEDLDPEYILAYLKFTRGRYGFDRVLRASLGNMRADVSITVPLDENARPSSERQNAIATEFKALEAAQSGAIAALDDVLNARVAIES